MLRHLHHISWKRENNSSRETIFAGEIQIREDYIIKKCVNRLCVQNCNVEHLQVLSAREGRKKVRMHEKKKEAARVPKKQGQQKEKGER